MKFLRKGDVMDKTNFYELFIDGKNLDMDSLEPRLTELAKELFEHVESGTMMSMLLMLSSVLDHYEDCVDIMEELEIEKDSKLIQIFVLGFLNAVFQVEKLKSDNDKKLKKWNSSAYRVKNLDKFVSVLYHENEVSKRRAMEELDIKQSAMSNFYAKTEKLNLYRSKKYGNEVYYAITGEGREYYNFCLSQKKPSYVTMQEESEHIIRLLDGMIREKQHSGIGMSGWHVVEVFEAENDVQLMKSKIIEHKINVVLAGDENGYGKIKNKYCREDSSDDTRDMIRVSYR